MPRAPSERAVAPFSRMPVAIANLSADAVVAPAGQCRAIRTRPRCPRAAPAMAGNPLFSTAICYNFGTRGIL